MTFAVKIKQTYSITALSSNPILLLNIELTYYMSRPSWGRLEDIYYTTGTQHSSMYQVVHS